MNMDYSITRQLSSQIPDRVSTHEIKAGLERIKKAQEQVLLELKRTHPDHSIDLTHQSHPLAPNFAERDGLKRELTLEREKSTEKSTLYRRRVVDLEASLSIHEENQRRLKLDNKNLEDQLRTLRMRYSDLEKDYEKLVEQSEVSNRNLRNLERQVMQLVRKLQEEDPQKLRTQFEQINAERNSIMAEKVALLKVNSKMQSENIELKATISAMVAELADKSKAKINQKAQLEVSLKPADIKVILNQIYKMNTAHQSMFSSLKSNSKLSRNLIESENSYQNSLNKILQILNIIQKGQGENGLSDYKFDPAEKQISFREEVEKVENELMKKHKKEVSRLTAEKEELMSKNRGKDKRIEELSTECEQREEKINRLRKEKSSLMNQLSELTIKMQGIRQNKEKQDSKRIDQQLKKQKSKDEEYRVIIQELNEQMLTIQKQKRDLDGLIGKMTNNKSEEEQKNKRKLDEILQVNNQIREENERIKEKYETIFVEKEHLYLSLNECQNKNNSLNKELAREVLQKEKLFTQLNRMKQQSEMNSAEVHKYKLLIENTKKQCENLNNSYLMEIERLIQESLQLRQEIEGLILDRNQLRELKGKYGLLMKDNQILGRRARQVNNQVDHLWMIKQVEYQNVNNILKQLMPL